MARKPETSTVTISMNRDGTYNFRSRNFDLRKLFPAQVKTEAETVAEPAPAASPEAKKSPAEGGAGESGNTETRDDLDCSQLDVHPSQQTQQHAAEKNGQSVSGDPHGPSPLSECEEAFCTLAAEESSIPASTAADIVMVGMDFGSPEGDSSVYYRVRKDGGFEPISAEDYAAALSKTGGDHD